MTIALKIGNQDSQVQGFIYLDAVTAYTKSLSGKVTSFPMDSGANVADHFIASNQKFTIEGVVSDVDVTGGSDMVVIGDQKPLNAKPKPPTPYIQGHEAALQFLPSSIKQFFERAEPFVGAEGATQISTPSVEMLFEELMRGTYYNEAQNRWRNKMTPTVLYEMVGNQFVNAKTDLIITNVDIKEDPDSGDALYLSLTMERVRFVTINQTDMPKLAKTSVKKKVASTEKKGSPTCPAGSENTAAEIKNALAPKRANTFIESKVRRDVAYSGTGEE